MTSSELAYATCSLLYADNGADLWFIESTTMAACEGKLFRMLCKMGRDDDVKRHIAAMPLIVLARGLVAACRHGRLHVVITMLRHLTTSKGSVFRTSEGSATRPSSLSGMAEPSRFVGSEASSETASRGDDDKSLWEAMCNTPFKFKHRSAARMPDTALERAIRFGHMDIIQQLANFTNESNSPSPNKASGLLTPGALHQGLIDAIRYKRRDILQFLLGCHPEFRSDARDAEFWAVYKMWRMVVTVGATDLAELLPTAGVQAMYEQAALDDNWALLLLLQQQCQENVHITEAMLPRLARSHGALRHVSWLLSQHLPSVTLCLRPIIRRAIKVRDWAATEALLKSPRTPIFMDDALWVCQSLLDNNEADRHMSLFRIALQHVENPLTLFPHAVSREPQPGNNAALIPLLSAVRHKHIFMEPDITRRAVLALAAQGVTFESSLMNLLDLIGQDYDVLQPILTRLWSTLAASGAWSSLGCSVDWALANPFSRAVPLDSQLATAIDLTMKAGQNDLVQRLHAVQKVKENKP